MKLNVPILSQRDPRWASQRLGTVDGTTIGGYGCIITCMTMQAQYYGHNLTPADMDNWLTDNQGYVQGNLYRNDAFHREFEDCFFDRIVFCTDTPAPVNLIKDSLTKGFPVVVMVDFDHDPNDGIQTHFVLVVGEENGDLIINDPWYGDQVFFKARYGKDEVGINQINFFSGKIPQVKPQLEGLSKEVGYNPDHLGQTVEVNGKTYQSMTTSNGLVWVTVVHQDPPPTLGTIEIPVTSLNDSTTTSTESTTGVFTNTDPVKTETTTSTQTTTLPTTPETDQKTDESAQSENEKDPLGTFFKWLWQYIKKYFL